MPKLTHKKSNKPVNVICSGDIMKYKTRKEAFDYFGEGVCVCDGSERDRYMNILDELENTDKDTVTDEY